MITPLERLKTLINSSTPIVIVETLEEKRAISMVRTVCAQLHLPLFEWSIATGLVRCGSTGPLTIESGKAASKHDQIQKATHPLGLPEQIQAMIGNTREPAQVLAHLETLSIDTVVILKDFHRHMDDPIVVRRLRDVGQKFCCPRRTLVLTGPSIEVPPELASLVEYVELPLPDAARLLQIVEETYERLCWQRTLKRTIDSPGLQTLANNLRGLTEEEAERSVSQAVLARCALCPEVVTDVLEEKKSLLRHSGMLEFIEVSDNFGSIGGLDNLKHWLEQRRGAWEQPARDYGLEPPRGVIIMGVQGCGKSLCARAIAGEWKLPLVKCNTAALFDKYVGGTEKHIKRLFQVCEELAPAVLWIDEMEKVFAGSEPGSASSDAGVSSRLLGSFLSWMQDRTAPVFIAATSNNVKALPPELIRKGRFDELFFVDLPNTAERRAILALHLSRHKQNAATFDLDNLAAAAQGYSGAELDAAVQTAMYASFAGRNPLTTERVLQALQCTVPLSATRAEEIQALRRWAQHRAVPASVPES
jgi:ATP-dependent 26S proteasome regulatory subunit